MTWRQIRKDVLARDQWRCCDCGEAIKGRDAHVHHKLPRALGGDDTPENLISLCSGCHSLKHMNLQASLGRRFLEKMAVRVAKFFDKDNSIQIDGGRLGLALRYLNVKKLRSGQLEPIMAALSGKSVLFVSATGSGKSLCFQLPALMQANKSIVISPLKALMSDQVSGLLARGFPATFINSDLPKFEIDTRLALIKENKCKLIYMAPERLKPSRHRAFEQGTIFSGATDYLVVDEAHCIDKWGDAFRPSYSDIGVARKTMGNPPVLAFTATAGRKTRQRILHSLNSTDAELFVEGVDRPNIAMLRFHSEKDIKRVELIKNLFNKMHTETGGKALIFVSTVKQGNAVLNLLQQHDLKAEFFHGKLSPKNRDFLLGRFTGRLEERVDLLICTNAFGMGMDIPNVRIVFHWQHPSSPEDYLQEFGRAGRDGKQSLAVLFTKNNDVGILDFMLRKSLDKMVVDETQKQRIYQVKSDSIDLINQMSKSKTLCFNKLIRDELDTEKRGRQSLSKLILEWVFSEKQRRQKRKYCCDACFRKKNSRPLSYFAEDIIRTMPSRVAEKI
jgi:ATP-dependent DNA helicase RecQ